MRRIPSVDTIEQRINCDRDTAIQVRRLLDGRDDPESFTKVAKWVRQCANRPAEIELIMAACDEVLDTCGVEAMRSPQNGWDRFWGDTVAIYCNNGQSYDPTVLYDVEREVFYITSTGDWQETAERNHRYKL